MEDGKEGFGGFDCRVLFWTRKPKWRRAMVEGKRQRAIEKASGAR